MQNAGIVQSNSHYSTVMYGGAPTSVSLDKGLSFNKQALFNLSKTYSLSHLDDFNQRVSFEGAVHQIAGSNLCAPCTCLKVNRVKTIFRITPLRRTGLHRIWEWKRNTTNMNTVMGRLSGRRRTADPQWSVKIRIGAPIHYLDREVSIQNQNLGHFLGKSYWSISRLDDAHPPFRKLRSRVP